MQLDCFYFSLLMCTVRCLKWNMYRSAKKSTNGLVPDDNYFFHDFFRVGYYIDIDCEDEKLTIKSNSKDEEATQKNFELTKDSMGRYTCSNAKNADYLAIRYLLEATTESADVFNAHFCYPFEPMTLQMFHVNQTFGRGKITREDCRYGSNRMPFPDDYINESCDSEYDSLCLRYVDQRESKLFGCNGCCKETGRQKPMEFRNFNIKLRYGAVAPIPSVDSLVPKDESVQCTVYIYNTKGSKTKSNIDIRLNSSWYTRNDKISYRTLQVVCNDDAKANTFMYYVLIRKEYYYKLLAYEDRLRNTIMAQGKYCFIRSRTVFWLQKVEIKQCKLKLTIFQQKTHCRMPNPSVALGSVYSSVSNQHHLTYLEFDESYIPWLQIGSFNQIHRCDGSIGDIWNQSFPLKINRNWILKVTASHKGCSRKCFNGDGLILCDNYHHYDDHIERVTYKSILRDSSDTIVTAILNATLVHLEKDYAITPRSENFKVDVQYRNKSIWYGSVVLLQDGFPTVDISFPVKKHYDMYNMYVKDLKCSASQVVQNGSITSDIDMSLNKFDAFGIRGATLFLNNIRLKKIICSFKIAGVDCLNGISYVDGTVVFIGFRPDNSYFRAGYLMFIRNLGISLEQLYNPNSVIPINKCNNIPENTITTADEITVHVTAESQINKLDNHTVQCNFELILELSIPVCISVNTSRRNQKFTFQIEHSTNGSSIEVNLGTPTNSETVVGAILGTLLFLIIILGVCGAALTYLRYKALVKMVKEDGLKLRDIANQQVADTMKKKRTEEPVAQWALKQLQSEHLIDAKMICKVVRQPLGSTVFIQRIDQLRPANDLQLELVVTSNACQIPLYRHNAVANAFTIPQELHGSVIHDIYKKDLIAMMKQGADEINSFFCLLTKIENPVVVVVSDSKTKAFHKAAAKKKSSTDPFKSQTSSVLWFDVKKVSGWNVDQLSVEEKIYGELVNLRITKPMTKTAEIHKSIVGSSGKSNTITQTVKIIKFEGWNDPFIVPLPKVTQLIRDIKQLDDTEQSHFIIQCETGIDKTMILIGSLVCIEMLEEFKAFDLPEMIKYLRESRHGCFDQKTIRQSLNCLLKILNAYIQSKQPTKQPKK